MPISLVAMTVTPLAVYSEVQVQVSSIALIRFNVIINTRSRRTRALLQMKGSANLLWAVFALQSRTDLNLDFCANPPLTGSFACFGRYPRFPQLRESSLLMADCVKPKA